VPNCEEFGSKRSCLNFRYFRYGGSEEILKKKCHYMWAAFELRPFLTLSSSYGYRSAASDTILVVGCHIDNCLCILHALDQLRTAIAGQR
jgi:hypothetical protein